MACNCGSARSARLSRVATRKATKAANAGIKIKKAAPKRVAAKKATAKKAKPCKC